MNEATLDMLTALTTACEGSIIFDRNGIHRTFIDDDMNLFVELQDGRTVRPEEVETKLLDDAVITFRQEHPGFFQRILGAMM